MLSIACASAALLGPVSTPPTPAVAGSAAPIGRRALLGGAAALALARPALADTQVKKFFTTDGGVKYFDLKEGGGYSPKDGDFVIIEYKSFNSKGQMYDSSNGPGRKPLAAKYKANQILAGWEEALETMREGGTRVLQVPASLAYGDKGVCLENGECLVQPGERLQFELTLKRVAMPPATTRDF